MPRVVAKYLLLLPNASMTELARPLLDRTPLYSCNATDGVCRCVPSSQHACEYMNSAIWTGCNRVR